MASNIWVVIPAFNEASMIGQVVQGVRQHYPNVVVVDDASRDLTALQARQAGATVLQHLINRGQGATLKTGIAFALQQGADVLVTFDADAQHRVEDIAKLIAPVTSGQFDIALGSRFLENSSSIPPLRRAVLQLAVIFTRLVSRIDVTDTHNGLRAMNRQAAERIRIVQDRFAHASEILDEIVRHQLRYCEVPVHITYSYYSKEKGQRNSALLRLAFKFLISKLTH